MYKKRRAARSGIQPTHSATLAKQPLSMHEAASNADPHDLTASDYSHWTTHAPQYGMAQASMQDLYQRPSTIVTSREQWASQHAIMSPVSAITAPPNQVSWPHDGASTTPLNTTLELSYPLELQTMLPTVSETVAPYVPYTTARSTSLDLGYPVEPLLTRHPSMASTNIVPVEYGPSPLETNTQPAPPSREKSLHSPKPKDPGDDPNPSERSECRFHSHCMHTDVDSGRNDNCLRVTSDPYISKAGPGAPTSNDGGVSHSTRHSVSSFGLHAPSTPTRHNADDFDEGIKAPQKGKTNWKHKAWMDKYSRVNINVDTAVHSNNRTPGRKRMMIYHLGGEFFDPPTSQPLSQRYRRVLLSSHHTTIR